MPDPTTATKSPRPPAVQVMRKLGLEPDPWQIEVLEAGHPRLLLKAFTGISLAVVEVAGQVAAHLTPLSDLQQKLLDHWGLPSDLYQHLTLHFPEPPPI